jgi:hypothetical protein
MATSIISISSARYVIHPVGHEDRLFFGTRAACIRHAYTVDGDSFRHLRATILARLPEPEWWILETVTDWAIRQLPPDHPEVVAAYVLDQGVRRLGSADWESWVDDWLVNGDWSRRAERRLRASAAQYLLAE